MPDRAPGQPVFVDARGRRRSYVRATGLVAAGLVAWYFVLLIAGVFGASWAPSVRLPLAGGVVHGTSAAQQGQPSLSRPAERLGRIRHESSDPGTPPPAITHETTSIGDVLTAQEPASSSTGPGPVVSAPETATISAVPVAEPTLPRPGLGTTNEQANTTSGKGLKNRGASANSRATSNPSQDRSARSDHSKHTR